MNIKNLTRKKVLSDDFSLCSDSFSKFIGLMFSQNKNKTLIFRFKNERFVDLHMFFVFYPIDVLFVDKNKIVVDKKENFKPFRFYKSKKKAMYAIELKEGIIKETKTKIGDKIEF